MIVYQKLRKNKIYQYLLATPIKQNLYLKTHLNELTNPNTMENTHDKTKETRKKYI